MHTFIGMWLIVIGLVLVVVPGSYNGLWLLGAAIAVVGWLLVYKASRGVTR